MNLFSIQGETMATITKTLTPDELDYFAYKSRLSDNEYNEFVDLICNALKIDNLPEHVAKDWVIKSLLQKGAIGIYQLNTELWLPASPDGKVDEMGKPLNWFLSTANGKTFNVKTDSKSLKGIIRLRPSGRGLDDWLKIESDNLAYILMSKKANLIATENCNVYQCGNDKTVIEMKSVFKKRAIGMPAIFSRKDGIDGDVKNLGNNVPYIADKLNQLYEEDKNKVKQRLGILTANSDKKERVQVGEITASVGEAVDSIYTIIDTFNNDAKRFGIPARMSLNGTIEDLYADYNEDSANNEMEKENNDNSNNNQNN